ncbi:hypothetical protein [Oceanivirga salmonicida]|uniref:hypothetical protein n=1 Tax=Oceanivirga salmonicida TaxID=1769291 RepID=UPI00082F2581|nr:hypothetical protein [Oceanivirga salmonicida]
MSKKIIFLILLEIASIPLLIYPGVLIISISALDSSIDTDILLKIFYIACLVYPISLFIGWRAYRRNNYYLTLIPYFNLIFCGILFFVLFQ